MAPTDSQQLEPRRRVPKIQFRVLTKGRADAGKTAILQKVRETTESPIIYQGDEELRSNPARFACESDLTADQVKLEPSMGASVSVV